MDKEQLCKSLVKWLQTFKIDIPHETIEDLSDGVAMAEVLGQIAPEWFDSLWMTKIKVDTMAHWRVKVSNLKKILKGILDYYTEVLEQQIIDFKLPDVTEIGEHNNTAELGRLLQLILGCAVNCDHKQEYIEAILGMEEADQHVVMNAIQELMTKETPNTLGSDNFDMKEQLKRLMNELQTVSGAKEQIAQRCHELDLQVTALQEEKQNLIAENHKLTEKLSQAEGLNDISSAAGRRNQVLQYQVEQCQEELYKIEQSREDYRSKVEELEHEIKELQEKNEELQRIEEEARALKDEIDVLRETSDKVAKYESVIESYKKKLEDFGDLKRQLKILEDKNTVYMQQNMELEEELKRNATMKTQLEMYKKQVQELHTKLSEETKRADKNEFEKKKLQEKLASTEREKTSLTAERDALKETIEELKLTQLFIESTSSPDKGGHSSTVGTDNETFEMIPPEVKEKIIRLEHENKMLKISRQGSDDEQIQVLQSMLDDSKERQSELETETRLANQRIIELESQLEELHSSQSAVSNQEGAEMRQKLNSSLTRIKELEMEISKKAQQNEQQDKRLSSLNSKFQQLQEDCIKKDDEIRAMEERYKKYLVKAKSAMRTLDPNVVNLTTQLQEKDKFIENLEKESKESQAMREMEEKVMLTAFYNLGMQLHREAVKERLANLVSGQSFLARQRQATSRRMGVGLGQSDFFD
ncbi:Protein Hook 3, variant 3 [Chamberlinius hualienensis]